MISNQVVKFAYQKMNRRDELPSEIQNPELDDKVSENPFSDFPVSGRENDFGSASPVEESALPIKAFHKGSISSNSPGLSPSYIRLGIYRKNYLLFAMVVAVPALFSLTIAVWLFNNNQAILGSMLGVVGILIGLLAIVVGLVFVAAVKTDGLAIEKGLLTPAIPSTDHSKMYTLINVSNGLGATYYGVQELKCKPKRGETEIACSSTFMAGKERDRWGRYDSIPLRVGSFDAQGILGCHSRIDAELWKELKRVVQKHKVPGFGEMLLLDESFELIDVVCTRLRDSVD